MCDYSLMSLPNLLARQGEELVVYRFPCGAMGLASPSDLRLKCDPLPSRLRNFWRALQATPTIRGPTPCRPFAFHWGVVCWCEICRNSCGKRSGSSKLRR